MRLCYLILIALTPFISGCFPVVATGVGAGALMVEDRRTAGAYVEDEAIELKTSNNIRQQLGSQAHITVTSYNRMVLLTGEAPNDNLKSDAGKIAFSMDNVRDVINEISIASPSSLTSRSNDTFITSKVKALFVDAQKFQINHIKVVTEAGVVYLLGIVKHKEADDAVEIARTTAGVRKVVKVFEYID